MTDAIRDGSDRLPPLFYDEVVRRALEEDLGTGDVTTDILVPPERQGRARVYAKEYLVVAGIEVASCVFTCLSPAVFFPWRACDGDRVEAGGTIMEMCGPLRALLHAERVALNFLQHLSGVATMTRRFVEAVSGTRARIVDTRKTLPGLRRLEKYAVRVGGGSNHRGSLSEGVLVKENHIAACGGIRPALEALRRRIPHLVRIEVEARSIPEVGEALEAGADAILLDNMAVREIAEAVALIGGRVPVEVSGGVHLANVREIAETGVDFISVGRVTHSAPAVDISMCVEDGSS